MFALVYFNVQLSIMTRLFGFYISLFTTKTTNIKFDPGACWNGHVSASACSPTQPFPSFPFYFSPYLLLPGECVF